MSEPAFDIEKIGRSLERSEPKRRVWTWVGAKAIGEPFYGQEISEVLQIRRSTVHYQLKPLEELELIARDESLSDLSRHLPAPLVRIESSLWVPVGGLLARHGIVDVTQTPSDEEPEAYEGSINSTYGGSSWGWSVGGPWIR